MPEVLGLMEFHLPVVNLIQHFLHAGFRDPFVQRVVEILPSRWFLDSILCEKVHFQDKNINEVPNVRIFLVLEQRDDIS